MHNFIAFVHYTTNTLFRIQFIILAELSSPTDIKLTMYFILTSSAKNIFEH